jgi:hypothetical protein
VNRGVASCPAMSFSCPHFCPDEEHCLRLKTDCVPGRPGCVLGNKSVFAVPVEERIRAREEEKRQRALEKITKPARRD